MNLPTNLKPLYPQPERMTWRDKAASNALGLLGLVLLTVLGFAVYGAWHFVKGFM